jgi:hypothetical protein
MGYEERFPPTRLSAGCGFRKETTLECAAAGMRRNGRDVLIPGVRATPIGPLGSTQPCGFRMIPTADVKETSHAATIEVTRKNRENA